MFVVDLLLRLALRRMLDRFEILVDELLLGVNALPVSVLELEKNRAEEKTDKRLL